VDSRVLGFTVAVSALTGIIFGLAPALHSSSESLNETLKEGGRTSSIGSRQWMRNALVVTEVALSLVLLIGAGLLIRSFARLREVNPGFDSRNVLTAMIALPQNRYPDDAHRRQFYTQALGEIQRLPGVVSAGTITPLPLTGMGWQNDYRIEGRPVPAAGEFPNTDMHYVSPSYLDTMRIPLQRGRQFSEADGENSLPVVLVNQTFAQRWFPNEDALGKRVRLCGSCEGRDMKRFPWYTIVGVVSDVRQYGLDAQPKTEVYVSYLQAPRGFTFFVVRTAGDPMALADSLRAGIQRVDKDQPVFGVRSMEQLVDRSLSVKKASMFLLAVFATVALLLAAIGIYGVISYTVGQRTQEIGIRMALGARRVDVLKMVVGQGFSIAAIGLGVGLMLALALTRLIRSLLFEVRATDPVTFIGLLVVLGSVALLACVIPAQRATRVEPVTALRYE
jgi:putative ABC transport system permease protein